MSHEQYKRDRRFFFARAIAKALLEQGLIDERQFKQVTAKLIAEFQPVLGTLYA